MKMKGERVVSNTGKNIIRTYGRVITYIKDELRRRKLKIKRN